MDLTKFTNSPKKEVKIKKEILLDNDEIKICKIGGEAILFVKKKGALEKYQNFLFCAPTHSKIIEDDGEAQEFFEKSLEEGVEGLMFKNMDSI